MRKWGWIPVSLLWAQLSGTYYINGFTSIAGRSFATLQTAFDELAMAGAQGTVRLHIVSPYNPSSEPSTILVKPYVCQNCEVIVQADTPVTIATSPQAEWRGGQFVLRILGGVQHFTLNGRGWLRLKSLRDTTALTGVIGIVPREGAPVSHIRIDSCILEGYSRRGTKVALYVGDSVSVTLQPVVSAVSNLSVSACTLRAAQYGAALLAWGWGPITNVSFLNNTFGYPTTVASEGDSAWGRGGNALYAYYPYTLTVENNIAYGAWEEENFTPVAFRIEYGYDVIVRANRIYNLRSLSSEGYGAVGIHVIRESRYGSTSCLIENNFIANLVGGADESIPGSSSYAVAGILLESAPNPDVTGSFTLRHNTIHLSGAAETTAPWARDGFAAGIIVGKNIRGGVEMSGNLIQNTLQISSAPKPDYKEVCGIIFWENPAYIQWSSFTLQNNFYFIQGPVLERTFLCRLGWGDEVRYIGSLAEWRAFTGQEAFSRASVQGGVPFVSAETPHISSSSAWEGINAGPVPLVTSQDCDGEARPMGGSDDPGSAPDIGADELAGKVYPCPMPFSQPLIPSRLSGMSGEAITFSVPDASALAGEIVLMWSLDGGLTWQSHSVLASQFPLTLPLPSSSLFPSQVIYRLAAFPLGSCGGSPDTSASVIIQLTDRPGNRPANAISLSLNYIGDGIWEVIHQDSLLGPGITDILTPEIYSEASRSADLFFHLTLPECLDSIEVDLCSGITDFDTRLHLLSLWDTLTDRDQGLRLDCPGESVPGAYTSRIVAIGAHLSNSNSFEDYTQPTRAYLSLPAGENLFIAVEGETLREIGRFLLRIKAYKQPLPKPNLGEDRSICYSEGGVTLRAGVRGATAYSWYLNGQILPNHTDSVANFSLPIGVDTIVVEARRDPSQPCAQPQLQRDTLVLTILPNIDATIVYEGFPRSNGDTLVLSFGYHTLSAQAVASGASYSWFVWDNRGVLIDWYNGPSYEREWGIRGLYMVELLTQTPDCQERDTLYVKVVPLQSYLYSEAAHFHVYPNPSQGTVFIRLPYRSSSYVAVYDQEGRKVIERYVSKEVEELSLTLPAGVYRLMWQNAFQQVCTSFLIID
ncbi:MAG: T9SS type A sorting domain-containing protein [Bacteroidia bacterium]|nr:T9SS type A sorting domain-containing protein [Bacteroidia bacterium]MDW8134270.1 T9SS type A sorting domain-containing protein [Bacteroidia bacterium]